MRTTTARVVYIGRRLLTGQKIAYWYHELDDRNTLGAAKGASQPYQADLPIGAILEIRHPDNDASKILMNGPRSPRVIAAWPDAADITAWRTADRIDAQAALIAQRAREDLHAIPDTFEQALNDLADYFAPLTPNQKAALFPLVQARILSATPLIS